MSRYRSCIEIVFERFRWVKNYQMFWLKLDVKQINI